MVVVVLVAVVAVAAGVVSSVVMSSSTMRFKSFTMAIYRPHVEHQQPRQRQHMLASSCSSVHCNLDPIFEDGAFR